MDRMVDSLLPNYMQSTILKDLLLLLFWLNPRRRTINLAHSLAPLQNAWTLKKPFSIRSCYLIFWRYFHWQDDLWIHVKLLRFPNHSHHHSKGSLYQMFKVYVWSIVVLPTWQSFSLSQDMVWHMVKKRQWSRDR